MLLLLHLLPNSKHLHFGAPLVNPDTWARPGLYTLYTAPLFTFNSQNNCPVLYSRLISMEKVGRGGGGREALNYTHHHWKSHFVYSSILFTHSLINFYTRLSRYIRNPSSGPNPKTWYYILRKLNTLRIKSA